MGCSSQRRHKEDVEEVIKDIAKYPSQSWQKLEWNVGDRKRKITVHILKFRALGSGSNKNDFGVPQTKNIDNYFYIKKVA